MNKSHEISAIEYQSMETIKLYQEQKLKELLIYLEANSSFYKRHFQKHHIDIRSIQTLDDLQQIHTSTKKDLQQYNADFICSERNKIIDYITTSGTLSEPVTFALTEKDLQRLAYNEYLSFKCAGLDSSDIVQLMVTMDKRFMAGMAYFLGLRKMGAGIVRVGAGSPGIQFDSIQRFQPTAIVVVPSFLIKLIEYAQTHQINLEKTSIKKAICIGEPVRNPDFSLNALGKKIKEHWEIELFTTYASTEMSTAFTECTLGQGGHHHPELIIVEFLDERNEPVSAGEIGEVTVTTLGVEGMPLLRFKTGDLCHHYTEKCACGRSSMRLGPIIGRKQQMLKLKGTTIYPPAIFDVLNNQVDVVDYVIEVDSNYQGSDEVKVKLYSEKKNAYFVEQIKDAFRMKLRVAPEIEFCSQAEIKKIKFPKNSRKPIRFIDKR